MNERFGKSLFLFRRDLRLEDNTGLDNALRDSRQVIPAFIFDPRQIEKNDYKGDNILQFMRSSLAELDSCLQKHQSRLYCLKGEVEQVVERLLVEESIDALFVNSDYTPFARNRDESLQAICAKHNVKFFSSHDSLLAAPGEIIKSNGEPYRVFTPFYKAASRLQVEPVQKRLSDNFYNRPIANTTSISQIKIYDKENPRLFLKGGRKEALVLRSRIEDLVHYDEERDIPSKQGTTGLSAHNKFGTASIREVYHTIANRFGKHHTLIRELYWRDFFIHIAYFFPHVFGESFYREYDKIKWRNDERLFEAWCRGTTGFPLIDAGMRELNASGYMHNRVRMATASFLVKDLHIDWRWGEKYFAQNLIDYDPSVNNGNWQWAASTGCDAQPYFRIFNPWRQQQRFDPECEYIKKWIPELEPYTPKEISRLEKSDTLPGYPHPIVNHPEAVEIAKEMFAAVKKRV